jgi:hypothetical protein
MYSAELEAAKLFETSAIKANHLDAVFFANYIGDGQSGGKPLVSAGLSATLPASQPLSIGLTDWRCRSIRDAVKFAKSNNLLGLICQARLLVQSSLLVTF